MRREFAVGSVVTVAAVAAGSVVEPKVLWSLVLLGPLLIMGYIDFFQHRHAIRRNFPLLGRFRYMFEAIRPEINQYFVESNSDGVPFSREQRSVVYQRAKRALDTLPFGTQLNVYDPGYEWVNHSVHATHIDPESMRVKVGGPDCTQPYNASLFNISAMSYGSMSSRAVLALSGGAKDGNFALNTGEGSISRHHLEPGGDLIWQIGTGYFGCRTPNGEFCEENFKQRATLPEVKMIEIKISQGAKPGHGGILPAGKLTPEICEIRGVVPGKDVISPPSHSAFSTPVELMEFVARLRELSGGKPVGFKICMGKRREFISMIKAMGKTGITPDFIVVDGGEGGTGAAPIEFSNHIGAPGIESLIFAHNALVGFDLRDKVKIIATGKITTGFGIIKRLCLGADMVYAARAFMMALGCIQALRCNSNVCPTGVATQDPNLVAGLVVSDKRKRVNNYHAETLESTAHIMGAMGLESTSDLRPWHLMRRIRLSEVQHYGEIFDFLKPGDLLKDPLPYAYARAASMASPDTFRALEES